MDDDESDARQQPDDAGKLESPAHERGGATVEEAIARAEVGSEVEGTHTPVQSQPQGESRVERMPDVPGVTEPRVDGTPGEEPAPEAGPSPEEVGSGGAQRIVGARISDRVSAGEDVPDGPPFGERPDESADTPI